MTLEIQRIIFWAIASDEADVKRTHSSLPGTTIKTLVRILGKPNYSISGEDDGEDIKTEERLAEILKENKFFTTYKRKQVPLMLAIGDGVFTVTYNKNISNKPIIEFIDGRNCAFEWFGDICTTVYTRKYYSHNKKNYMLLEKRSTINENGKKKSNNTIYALYAERRPKTKHQSSTNCNTTDRKPNRLSI